MTGSLWRGLNIDQQGDPLIWIWRWNFEPSGKLQIKLLYLHPAMVSRIFPKFPEGNLATPITKLKCILIWLLSPFAKEGEAFYQEKHKLQKTSGRGILRQEKVAKKGISRAEKSLFIGGAKCWSEEKHGRGAKKASTGRRREEAESLQGKQCWVVPVALRLTTEKHQPIAKPKIRSIAFFVCRRPPQNRH